MMTKILKYIFRTAIRAVWTPLYYLLFAHPLPPFQRLTLMVEVRTMKKSIGQYFDVEVKP
jgi:hypothetical protein